jgi:Flp pilus assembly CpaF family ATPase
LGAIDTILADDEVSNVFVSGAKNIYLEKKGKFIKSATTFRDNVQLENMLKRIAQNEGFELDEYNPYFRFNHRQGVNVALSTPPLSNVPTVFVKCYKDKHATIQILQEELSISKEIALILPYSALFSVMKSIYKFSLKSFKIIFKELISVIFLYSNLLLNTSSLTSSFNSSK